MLYIIGDARISFEKPISSTMKRTIELDVDVFKDVLLHSWDILPLNKRRELRELGLSPDTTGDR